MPPMTTSGTSDWFVTINGLLAGRLDRLGLEVRGCLLSDRLVGLSSYDSPSLRGSLAPT